MAQIKGKHLLGLIRFVQEHKIEDDFHDILALCPEAQPYFLQRINPLLWYPFQALNQPMIRMVEECFDGDERLYHAFGRAGARNDIRNDYKIVFGAFGTSHPIEILKMSDFLWQDNFRNAGKLEIRHLDDTSCVLHLEGFQDLGRPYAINLEGWFDCIADSLNPTRFQAHVRLQQIGEFGSPTRFLAEWEEAGLERAEPYPDLRE